MLRNTADTAQVTLGRTRSLNENIEKKGVQLSDGGKYAPLLGRSTECAPGGREPNRRRNKKRGRNKALLQGDGNGSKRCAHKEKSGGKRVHLIPSLRCCYVHLS